MPALKVWLKRAKKRIFPSSPVVRTPDFHCRGSRVRSLVGELRSYKLCHVAKKKKKGASKRVKKSLLHLKRMFWAFLSSLHSELFCTLSAFPYAWEAGPQGGIIWPSLSFSFQLDVAGERPGWRSKGEAGESAGVCPGLLLLWPSVSARASPPPVPARKPRLPDVAVAGVSHTALFPGPLKPRGSNSSPLLPPSPCLTTIAIC